MFKSFKSHSMITINMACTGQHPNISSTVACCVTQKFQMKYNLLCWTSQKFRNRAHKSRKNKLNRNKKDFKKHTDAISTQTIIIDSGVRLRSTINSNWILTGCADKMSYSVWRQFDFELTTSNTKHNKQLRFGSNCSNGVSNAYQLRKTYSVETCCWQFRK